MPKVTKPVWILCPRCELNYIKKADKFCNVCKKEMKLIEGGEDDIGDLELCPICKINFVQNDEEICESCRQEMGIAVDEEREDKEIDDWHKYIDDDESHEESEEDEDGLTDGIYDSSELEDSSGVVEGFEFDEDMEKDLADAAGGDDEDLDLDMLDDEDDEDEDNEEDEELDDEDDDF
ncbi:MAG: hypothetical protein MJ149_00115 [Clostridia bacterium]|nr:hypothetical protein [Clostridia bacterium]